MIEIQKKNGFTLIEVILAITILATLSTIATIATSRALKSKRKIQTEVESVSALRDSLRMIRNDINLAYNHSDFEQDIIDESKKKTKSTPVAGAPPPLPGPSTTQDFTAPGSEPENSIRKSPATFFVGDEKSLNFITMNNGKMSANEVQADFIEVGYFLKNCSVVTGDQGRGDSNKKSQGSQCLYRRVQKIIDHDVTKGGVETMMLDDVTEFSLKYLVEGKLDWLKEWKADKKRYNIFPDAIEVTLAIEKDYDGKPKKYSIQYVVPIHFPNNTQKKNTDPGNTTISDGVPQ